MFNFSFTEIDPDLLTKLINNTDIKKIESFVNDPHSFIYLSQSQRTGSKVIVDNGTHTYGVDKDTFLKRHETSYALFIMMIGFFSCTTIRFLNSEVKKDYTFYCKCRLVFNKLMTPKSLTLKNSKLHDKVALYLYQPSKLISYLNESMDKKHKVFFLSCFYTACASLNH